MNTMTRWSLVALVGIVLAWPADAFAQGKKRGHEKQKDRQEVRVDRGDDRVVVRDRDGRVIVLEDDDRIDRPRRDRRDGIVLRDRNGRVIVLGGDDILQRRHANRGHGPPFCRNGAGHPVHGRAWCVEKGWVLGNRDRVFFDRDRVVFWDHDRSEAVWVRNVRLDRQWTLWTALANGVIELLD